MVAPYEHTPVLLGPVLEALAPQAEGRYIDATVGGGGHAAGILERSAPDGLLLGIDRDPEALALARRRLAPFGQRALLVQGDYARLGEIARQHGFFPAQGVLFDLGVASFQLASQRGFSFQVDAPLDMRYDPASGPTASELLATLGEDELAELLWRYGEEPSARRIARRIVQVRERTPIRTTAQLARLVADVVGGRRRRIHPATQTFMALRIAVNKELERLPQGLADATELLAPGGRLVVLTFHSLEDRLVKEFMRRESGSCDWPDDLPVEACPHLVPVQPGPRPCRSLRSASCARPARLRILGRARKADAEEIQRNPRARSVRMRVAERCPVLPETSRGAGKPTNAPYGP
jgi:16S rRNA (cytosine1402-N4)-methyltransferase